MTDTIIIAATALLVTTLLCATLLRAWTGWLDLRRAQLPARRCESGEAEAGLRIELAAVKERLKKLEAIASGVDP